MKETAIKFGTSLDNDDFITTKKLLSEDCLYDMGTEKLLGPKAIVDSYEQNMIAGRKKMDRLEWGQSLIEVISDTEFIVNFTDYLFHNGEQYTHHCQQRLFLNSANKINRIIHINDAEEHQRLQQWYKSVGIPTNNK